MEISPIYTSNKMKDEIKVVEQKRPVVNQQCDVSLINHFSIDIFSIVVLTMYLYKVM